jgi:hypothetical protein
LLLSACYQARYQQTRTLLDDCLSMPSDTVLTAPPVVADPFTIVPQQSLPADLVLPYTPEYVIRIDTVTLDVVEKDYYEVMFKPSYIARLQLDSLAVWIRVINLYEYGFFEQKFELFNYEIPARVEQDTVYTLKEVRDWRHVLAVGGVGVLIGAVIMLLVSRKWI